MQSLSWYVNRVRAMSPRELVYRAHRQLEIILQRSGLQLADCPPAPEKASGGANFISAPVATDPDLVRAANQILQLRYPVFQVQPHVLGTTLDWNRDPLTGTRAPCIFGKSLDYRDESLVGNIKYLWEPSRHLELVSLAQAYRSTGDPLYLRGIGEFVRSWLEQCPYPKGPHWSSSLELSIRLINWSLTWQLIREDLKRLADLCRDPTLESDWMASIYQHVDFVDRYYSRFSSANNHLIGEAAGVFIATCTWPLWPESEVQRARALTVLEREITRQTHSDGVNKEQAISYQQFVLDFLILSICAADANDIQLSGNFRQMVERMLEFVAFMIDSGGNIPMIGDADDGFVVRLDNSANFCPFQSLLLTGAVMFGRTDWLEFVDRADAKSHALVGVQAVEDTFKLKNRCSNDVPRAFKSGGYYSLVSDHRLPSETRLLVDAGPLGYLSIAAHGHADALAFVLSVAGHEILIDPGTYSYHTEPKWRRYFRGTSAHNTVCVDGEDQSVQGGNFMWTHHARASCSHFETDEQGGVFVGQHDGYTRLRDPLIHEREIRHTGSLIKVVDRLECAGYHSAQRLWHFSERCSVSVSDHVVTAVNGGVCVTMRPREKDTVISELRGSDEPPGGWVSRRFDVKIPTTTVVFENRIAGTSELVTEIEISQAGTA